jgi:hypothetical protein
LKGGADVEIIPNEFLGPKDYRGVALTGIECREIRHAVRANIASTEEEIGKNEKTGRVLPPA